MIFLNKEKNKEKIQELNLLIATLESHEVKYSIIYNLSNDITITISDKNSVRVSTKETKETKKKKE